MDTGTIKSRIAALEAEREQLLAAANHRLAEIAGELRAWGEVLETVEGRERENHPA